MLMWSGRSRPEVMWSGRPRPEHDLFRTANSSKRRQQLAGHFAEADAITFAFAAGRHGNAVAVGKKAALFAAGQFERLTSAPGQFQQTPARLGRRAADRARGQQIAGPQVAAVDRVMGDLLGDAPIQVAEVRIADDLWGV